MLFSDFYIKYHKDLTFLYPNTTKNKHFHTAINNQSSIIINQNSGTYMQEKVALEKSHNARCIILN